MKNKENIINQKEDLTLLRFITRTKDGKFAKIDQESLLYVRVQEEREDIDSSSELYYYTLS
jgi:hypothetical protein